VLCSGRDPGLVCVAFSIAVFLYVHASSEGEFEYHLSMRSINAIGLLVGLSILDEVTGLASTHPRPGKGRYARSMKKPTRARPSGRDNLLLFRHSSRSDHHQQQRVNDIWKKRLQRRVPFTVAELTFGVLNKPNCKFQRAHRITPGVQVNFSSPRIPQQLLLTGRNESLRESALEAQENIWKVSKASPKLEIRWLGDKACLQYLREHYDEELVQMFRNEVHGSFRGDICRTAVLLREGGFYMDLDVQLVLPLTELINNATSFMSVYEAPEASKGGMLNALLAAEPQSAVMSETLNEIRKWYRGEVKRGGWMGPETLLRAVNKVVETNCPCTSIYLRKQILQWPDINPQWSCGPHNFRFMVQRHLACGNHYNERECPEQRKTSQSYIVRQGLYFPGSERRFIGWPRPAWCSTSGCGFGGWANQNITSDLPV